MTSPGGRFALRADGGLRAAAKAVIAAADLIRRPADGVVILLYHRVGARSNTSVDLPVDLFDAQMAALAAEHDVVTLDDALAALHQRRSAPCVAVTFDDGTSDLVELALPVLSRHRIPSTWYIATEFVDEQRSFPDDGTPLSWSAIREACTTGLVSIGSHTHRHRLLDRASEVEIADELDRSIGSIGDQLGAPPADFAYPKALLGSPSAEAAVRARFRSAALAGTRANVAGDTDVHRLARSPIQVSDGQRWFRRKATGGMGLEDELRDLLNRRRYAGAST